MLKVANSSWCNILQGPQHFFKNSIFLGDRIEASGKSRDLPTRESSSSVARDVTDGARQTVIVVVVVVVVVVVDADTSGSILVRDLPKKNSEFRGSPKQTGRRESPSEAKKSKLAFSKLCEKELEHQ